MCVHRQGLRPRCHFGPVGVVMPRRADIPASPWLAPSTGDLAKRLGVSRNTPNAWRKAGAPAELDEYLWRVWAAGAGKDVPAPPSADLLQRLVAAGVRGYQAAAPSPATESPLAISTSLQGDPKAFGQYLANKGRLLDLQRQAGELLTVADCKAAIEACARILQQQLDAIPRLIADSVPSEYQAAVRRKVVDQVDQWRAQLAQEVRQALEQVGC